MRHCVRRLRYAVWGIAGTAALTAALSGCGQQVAGQQAENQFPYSESFSPAIASLAKATSNGSGNSGVNPAPASHRTGHNGGNKSAGNPGGSAHTVSSKSGTGADGDAIPGTNASTGDNTGASASTGTSSNPKTSSQGCPTSDVGGDDIPPPCPDSSSGSSSDAVPGPIAPSTPEPTTTGSSPGVKNPVSVDGVPTQEAGCPSANPDSPVSPSPTVSPTPSSAPSCS